jgi:hypothetical protein
MSTTFDMFILELTDFGYSSQVFMDHGSENAISFAMKNPDFVHIE